ncbi:MAG: peptide chain release factor N(5)-glutamine methyltransferase [Rhodocyclaceae bacterium]|jgi:release factor glutamine methyltransferase|nr:peptide chain release factor N(5)-glutamine methyltransferase [Rhodocyclaceae bacterium]MBK6676386.1 peptide chain release factor N(5)-glutamine methyltransferase [Rhodocyclaceae bacterium]MBK9312438.1 peptide chain release factor N(5)-glutamine methyltransferase [Rhodocyclaceae bacterium]MBK9955884.1 peptide chain release factor N(5)-glutamine methyltransferase [Rhodocyclaceae bacterium]
MTIAEALARARPSIAPAEARLLLRHVLGCAASDIAAHPERALDESQASRYADLVRRHAAGEPIAYILGSREFYGREFRVTSAVLIPRPETELLAEVAVAKVSRGDAPRILDLGAGSGCVAITLALELDAEVLAVDVSRDALAIARDNAARLGARVAFVESDWFAAVDGRFELIVGNPPYVAEGDPHLDDLAFEPMVALTSGSDGLAAIRHVVAEAPRYLKPGGWLLLEHGYDQAETLAKLLADMGFVAIERHRDLAGIVRVSGGRMPD